MLHVLPINLPLVYFPFIGNISVFFFFWSILLGCNKKKGFQRSGSLIEEPGINKGNYRGQEIYSNEI